MKRKRAIVHTTDTHYVSQHGILLQLFGRKWSLKTISM